MAHNLNFNEKINRHSFFTVKEKAWHGLGKVVETAVNSKQAIELAGLNFTVNKQKIFSNLLFPDGNTMPVEITEKYCTYRTDTNHVFGVIGKNYEIVQNADAFTFFDSIVGAGEAIYETAGCLGNGEVIFITAKLPGYIKVRKDDLIEQYLFLTSSHDGSGAIQAAFTPIRIVCNNTLNAALRGCTNKISIRHTTSAKNRLETAHKIMGITNKLSVELETIFNLMAKTSINDKQLKSLITLALAPNKEMISKINNDVGLSAQLIKNVDRCIEYAFTAESQNMETTRGTVFGAYNAITGYFQNIKEFKNSETKLLNIINGNSLTQTQRAFNSCQALLS